MPEEAKFNLPLLTNQQLAAYDGITKPRIYIAYKGFIYDVTRSRLWKSGQHYQHWAGQDLTEELKGAPHTEYVLERFEVVARLQP